VIRPVALKITQFDERKLAELMIDFGVAVSLAHANEQ
jgi:hypothetical protein